MTAKMDVDEKRFPCSYPGCNKRFTRAEHMQRHSLNHGPGEYTCDECRAHFKRPDLLRRHMTRHRQKDLEANRAGGGVLQTRKRSWRTVEGAIVQTRPDAQSSSSLSERDNNYYLQQSSQDLDYLPDYEGVVQQQTFTGPDSPPNSSSDAHSERRQSFATGHGIQDILIEPVNIDAFSGASNAVEYQAQCGANDGGWTDTCFQDFAALEYDQVFQPDTASSFNMPYTTALDYNWLFNNNNLDGSLIGDLAGVPEDQQPSEPATAHDRPQVDQPSLDQFTVPTPESLNSLADGWVQTSPCGRAEVSQGQVRQDDNINDPGSDNNYTFSPQPSQTPPMALASASSALPKSETTPLETERPLSMLQSPTHIPKLTLEVRERLLCVIEMANPHIPGTPCPVREHPLLDISSLDSYLFLYFTRFNTAYPLIHMATFSVTDVEPLLLLSALLLGASYSTKAAHQLAVCIHDVIRPSIFAHAGFSARPELWTLQTILLVECFGKSRAGQTQHDMSHLFHGLLINLIRRSDCQSVRPDGPPLRDPAGNQQTQGAKDEQAWRRWAQAEQKKRLALICFMCDVQHAVLFCQSLCMSAFELRVGLPCSQAIWEAPDAATWAARWRAASAGPGSGPGATPGSGRVVPLFPAITGASTTAGTRGATRAVYDDAVPFLAALKSYLTPNVPRPPRLSGLSRVLLLHGLMSVAWDMQRREQTALGVVTPQCDITNSRKGGLTGAASTDWRRIVSTAYDAWKDDFDAHYSRANAHLTGVQHKQRLERQQEKSTEMIEADDLAVQQKELTAFTAAYNAVYHSAQALLHMDFLDVQIYAGARHILGRPVQQRDYIRSSRVVRRWAADLWTTSSSSAPSGAEAADTTAEEEQKSGAGFAAWHAAQLLLDATENLQAGSSEAALGLFHVPWCLYLATLTCWAVHHAAPSSLSRPDENDEFDGVDEDDDEIVWDPEGEMRGFVAKMAGTRTRAEFKGLGRLSTVGLVWAMADELTKARWGIIRSGVVVLRGLVPQRLINRYEEPF